MNKKWISAAAVVALLALPRDGWSVGGLYAANTLGAMAGTTCLPRGFGRVGPL